MKAVVLRGRETSASRRFRIPFCSWRRTRSSASTLPPICGADLFPLHGLTPGFEYGTILGHEFAGVVAEVGSAVTSIRPGERVVNMSLVADGTCAACRAGRVTQCSGRALFGYSGVYPRLDGAQAEFVRVPHADTVLSVLPDSVSDEAAVFLADNLPTAYDAVVRGEDSGDLICVVGLGAVGLMAVMVAVDLGATVFATDGVDQRRGLAAGLGAQVFEPSEVREAVAGDRRTWGRRRHRGGRDAGRARCSTAARSRTWSRLGCRAHFEPDTR